MFMACKRSGVRIPVAPLFLQLIPYYDLQIRFPERLSLTKSSGVHRVSPIAKPQVRRPGMGFDGCSPRAPVHALGEIWEIGMLSVTHVR